MVKRRRAAGYNLVALVVGITVLSILTAAAMPLWSTAIRRDKEEELISRGLQYAEAIRVFAANIRSLLLQPPIRGYRVLGLDPGFRTGCKLAVVDPTAASQAWRSDAEPPRRGPLRRPAKRRRPMCAATGHIPLPSAAYLSSFPFRRGIKGLVKMKLSGGRSLANRLSR